jgi:chemotaxis protein histidine kinase CheA/ActR/RegA family two-component response regulator
MTAIFRLPAHPQDAIHAGSVAASPENTNTGFVASARALLGIVKGMKATLEMFVSAPHNNPISEELAGIERIATYTGLDSVAAVARDLKSFAEFVQSEPDRQMSHSVIVLHCTQLIQATHRLGVYLKQLAESGPDETAAGQHHPELMKVLRGLREIHDPGYPLQELVSIAPVPSATDVVRRKFLAALDQYQATWAAASVSGSVHELAPIARSFASKASLLKRPIAERLAKELEGLVERLTVAGTAENGNVEELFVVGAERLIALREQLEQISQIGVFATGGSGSVSSSVSSSVSASVLPSGLSFDVDGLRLRARQKAISSLYEGMGTVLAEVRQILSDAHSRMRQVRESSGAQGTQGTACDDGPETPVGHTAQLLSRSALLPCAERMEKLSPVLGYLGCHSAAHVIGFSVELLRNPRLLLNPQHTEDALECVAMLSLYAERVLPSQPGDLLELPDCMPSPFSFASPLDIDNVDDDGNTQDPETREDLPEEGEALTNSAPSEPSSEEPELDVLSDDFGVQPELTRGDELVNHRPVADVLQDLGQVHDLVDEVDTGGQLFSIMLAEFDSVFPEAEAALETWKGLEEAGAEHGACIPAIQALKRAAHTLKGATRTTGVLCAGAVLHVLEDEVERMEASRHLHTAPEVLELLNGYRQALDQVVGIIERHRDGLVSRGASPVPRAIIDASISADSVGLPPIAHVEAAGDANGSEGQEGLHPSTPEQEILPVAAEPKPPRPPQPPVETPTPKIAVPGVIRVRPELAGAINQASAEAVILENRIRDQLAVTWKATRELSTAISRVRSMMKELEIQAEIRVDAGRGEFGGVGTASNFDPLQMDRFTRLQELARSLAEGVNDISAAGSAIEGSLRRIEDAESDRALTSSRLQAEAARLMVVPFSSFRSRLARVVRQACTDVGRTSAVQAELVLSGDAEVPGPVIERLMPAVEHILRNAIAHGIEPSGERGVKPSTGKVSVTVNRSASGSDLLISVKDDGRGVDHDAVLERARARGVIAGIDPAMGESRIHELLFTPGFSTAAAVTELAGRGVGLDVVKTAIAELGGTVSIRSRKGEGTEFVLRVPSTLASMSVVPVTVSGYECAIPASLVDRVVAPNAEEIARARGTGVLTVDGTEYRFRDLEQALALGQQGEAEYRSEGPGSILLLKTEGASPEASTEASTEAFLVDVVDEHRKAVVRPLGRHLSGLPGVIAGTVNGSGFACLIVDPRALPATPVPEDDTRPAFSQPSHTSQPDLPPEATVLVPQSEGSSIGSPLVVLVDDSSTMRTVAGRCLRKHGYRVVEAKDGVDALKEIEALCAKGTIPSAFVFDIEMPRMDGFTLVGELRAHARFPELRNVPVVMVTSRTAQRHRAHAATLGVKAYLGKPYDEDELIKVLRALIA